MDRYPERVLIGEIYLPIPQLVTYYGATPGATPQLLGAQMPFNFHLIQTGWQADRIAQLIQQYEAALPPGAWPNWVMGNHDQKRLASRIGAAQARVAATLLLTLRGTPTLYYGDELGMADAHIAADQVVDPAARNGQGRDPERSPMLWGDGVNAGFTTGKPWLPLVASWEAFTVAAESVDSDSVLALYRKMLELRRLYPALHAGDISEVSAADGVLVYLRRSGEQRIQVLLNMTADERWPKCLRGEMLANSHLDLVGSLVSDYVQLRPDEAVVILVS